MKRFLIIGAGNFGYYAAKALFEDGNEVVVVDQDRDRVQAVDPFCAQAVVMDALDVEKLKALGLDDMDGVIVSTGNRISASVLICYHLNELGVKNVIVKAADEDHGRILKKLGARDVISPEKDIAYRLARNLTRPNIIDFIPLDRDYELVQIPAPPSFVKRPIRDLELREKHYVNIIGVKQKKPEKLILAPPADFTLREDDVLIILGSSKQIEKLKQIE